MREREKAANGCAQPSTCQSLDELLQLRRSPGDSLSSACHPHTVKTFIRRAGCGCIAMYSEMLLVLDKYASLCFSPAPPLHSARWLLCDTALQLQYGVRVPVRTVFCDIYNIKQTALGPLGSYALITNKYIPNS